MTLRLVVQGAVPAERLALAQTNHPAQPPSRKTRRPRRASLDPTTLKLTFYTAQLPILAEDLIDTDVYNLRTRRSARSRI